MELSVVDPNQLFDGIEKCYYNYVDSDKCGFGSHWFYHKDLDYGPAATANRRWASVVARLLA